MKTFIAVCAAAILVTAWLTVDHNAVASYIENAYMTAILNMSEAVTPADNDTIQRFNSVETGGSDTIQVLLSNDIETATITAHCVGVKVIVFNGATVTDSAFVWPGSSFPMYVADRDSLRIIRTGITRVDWSTSPSKLENMSPSYIRKFSKTCPIAHGDTLATGSVTYTQDQANMAAHEHAGTCVYFETLSIFVNGSVGDNGRAIAKCWMGDHLVAVLPIAVNREFYTESFRFDSLTILVQPKISVVGWSLSWNNRL